MKSITLKKAALLLVAVSLASFNTSCTMEQFREGLANTNEVMDGVNQVTNKTTRQLNSTSGAINSASNTVNSAKSAF